MCSVTFVIGNIPPSRKIHYLSIRELFIFATKVNGCLVQSNLFDEQNLKNARNAKE